MLNTVVVVVVVGGGGDVVVAIIVASGGEEIKGISMRCLKYKCSIGLASNGNVDLPTTAKLIRSLFGAL